MICLQKNWELIVIVLYVSYICVSYLCLICIQSCTFPFLFYHSTFLYFYLAQMSKNLFLFEFFFYRTGHFPELITYDIWNHWENSCDFHSFCNFQFQVFPICSFRFLLICSRSFLLCLFIIIKVVYDNSYSLNTTSIHILVTYLFQTMLQLSCLLDRNRWKHALKKKLHHLISKRSPLLLILPL